MGGGGGGGGGGGIDKTIPNGDTRIDNCLAEQLPRLPPDYS